MSAGGKLMTVFKMSKKKINKIKTQPWWQQQTGCTADWNAHHNNLIVLCSTWPVWAKVEPQLWTAGKCVTSPISLDSFNSLTLQVFMLDLSSHLRHFCLHCGPLMACQTCRMRARSHLAVGPVNLIHHVGHQNLLLHCAVELLVFGVFPDLQIVSFEGLAHTETRQKHEMDGLYAGSPAWRGWGGAGHSISLL